MSTRLLPELPAVRDGRPLRLGGLFSGVGGFELAWRRSGGEIAWMCEIDEHARKVLSARFPGVPIYADVRDIDPDEVAPVDVLTGGSPCTTFSMAGLRTGLDGESGLVLEMLRIIDGLSLRGLSDVVWENVPNVLSINNDDGTAVWPQLVAAFVHGVDAAADQVVEIDAEFPTDERWSWQAGLAATVSRAFAWRVLNSQYVGAQVPQRRRRLYAHLALGQDAAERAASGILRSTEPGTRDGCGLWVAPWAEQLSLFADAGRQATVSLVSNNASARAFADASEGRCAAGETADGEWCPGDLDEHLHVGIEDVVDADPDPRYRMSGRARLGVLLRSHRRETIPVSGLLRDALLQGLDGVLGPARLDALIAEADRGERDSLTVEEIAALRAAPVPEGPAERTSLFRCMEFGRYVASPVSATLLARDYKDGSDILVEHVAGAVLPDGPVRVTTGTDDPAATLLGWLPEDPDEMPAAAVATRCRRLTASESARLQGFPEVEAIDIDGMDAAGFVATSIAAGIVEVDQGQVRQHLTFDGFPLPSPVVLSGRLALDLGGATVKVDAEAFAGSDDAFFAVDGDGPWCIVTGVGATRTGAETVGWNAPMGTRREQLKACGNAVSANVAQWVLSVAVAGASA